MNEDHAELCSSAEWAEHIADTVLPAAIGALTLGDEVLEIGPGYGASTRQLADSVSSLTVVEVDDGLAKELAKVYPNVTVVQGSGDNLPFDAGRFSAVVCFTMLHHVLTQEMQDGLFAEARRVLRPGGVFAGSDSIDNEGWRELHVGDTCTPVDPGGLPQRLTTAGFVDIDVRVVEPAQWFIFSART
jgi:ubiquinone/menaquinone biosynthesis C-methylase UbiE